MSASSPGLNSNQASSITRKTNDILEGPIIPVMLKLALPTLAVLVVQTFVGIMETYFVSSLGADVLAGVSVVFPVLMLMQMMANGGIGSGLASAIARALGAGKQEEVQSLVWHGVVIAIAIGLLFAGALIIGGPVLYKAMGVSGPSLNAALSYSNIVFLTSPLIWAMAMLSASLRGAGDTKTPAFVTLVGAFILLPLSPALIFGWGPIPSFGVKGAGIAILIYYLLATIFLVKHMTSRKSVLNLSKSPLKPQLFKDILGVGVLASIGTVQINLTVTIVTATVGKFGPDAVAGYGIASRLEYLQVPLLFGLGTAIITMIGINLGAGQLQRAREITRIGAMIAFLFTTSIGFIIRTFPELWLTVFSEDRNVLSIGTSYLGKIAPFYGFIAVGMTLYFAAIGMKRVFWPVLAGTIRMIIAAFIGWIAVMNFDAGMPTLFSLLIVSILVYFTITVASMWLIFK
ncbi:MATE family efflux transporter [Vibrio fluvialis]|jgi:putative MATE family efflux protein|nr:MATE family efflux transporter [Vibrio fluvialis]EKO3971872.1 MATE family efflux transporter [Vibrio fluvialis]ELP3314281.1 MATE family efflux transporter [Vibrio fluvialis]